MSMKITVKSILFLLLLFTAGQLSADVFSLFPGRSGAAASGVDGVLHGKPLWSEEVDINGSKLELEVAMIDRTLEEALRDLRGRFKDGAAAVNSNSLLFEVPLDSGARKRYYLVELKGMIPMLQFSITLPRGFRKANSGVWDPELPLPPGGMPQTFMRFPKRNSVYGVFTSPYPAQQTLADLVRGLEQQGWKNMGRETTSSVHASGEVFLREKSHEILIISTQDAPDGKGCSASIYLRKLSGK
ncbi:MAG: hypothetical protein IJS14_00015 [Lentisphaeria bacterium]|nr:hypothetical protein [Lentisphaeria bacterium]